MKGILTLLLALSLLSNISITQAHDTQENYSKLSLETKNNLENRLSSFLVKTDTYEENLQLSLYQNIKQKVSVYKTKYNENSDSYSILEILDELADHKLDKKSILTNTQILTHILFGTSVEHYDISKNNAPEIEDNSSNGDTEENNETEGEDNSNTAIYRADLNTDALNELDKNILAGTAKGVMQIEFRANLESIKSKKVQFEFNQNIEGVGISANLYKNGILVGNSSQSDTKGNVMSFDNLKDFIIDTETTYIQLEIITEEIGKDKVGKSLSDIKVIRTILQDNSGLITGDSLGDKANTQVSKNFNIVPVDISASVESSFNTDSSISSIRIIPNIGKNNQDGDIFQARLESLKVQVSGFSTPGSLTIFNGSGDEIGSSSINGSGDYIITLSPDIISSAGESYRIITTARGLFILPQDAFTYSAGTDVYTSKGEKQLFLGQR